MYFFKQKTAYDMRMMHWSSDVCSSDLFQRDQTELWFRRAVQVRATEGVAAQATFLDIEYRSLIDDPVAAITHIYAAADMEPPPDPARFVAHYQAARPRHAQDRKSTRLNSSH